MNQYYGAYPPQSLTPQQAAALGGWQNNQNLQQMQGMGIQNGYPQQFVQAIPGRMIHDIQEVRPNEAGPCYLSQLRSAARAAPHGEIGLLGRC